MIGELKCCAPFSEASAHVVILFESFRETFEALSIFFVRVFEIDEALVDLDASNDTFIAEIGNEIFAVICMLAGSFIEEDDAAYELLDVASCKEEIAVIAAMLFVVWDTHALELFMDGATGFIGGENALACC